MGGSILRYININTYLSFWHLLFIYLKGIFFLLRLVGFSFEIRAPLLQESFLLEKGAFALSTCLIYFRWWNAPKCRRYFFLSEDASATLFFLLRDRCVCVLHDRNQMYRARFREKNMMAILQLPKLASFCIVEPAAGRDG